VRRIAFLLAFLGFFSVVSFGQTTQQSPLAQQMPPPLAALNVPSAPQDPEAVSIFNQVLSAAGGSTVIGGIRDYIAIGTVSLVQDTSSQGSITIQARGVSQIRIDANLGTSTVSRIISQGKTLFKKPDGSITQLPPSAKVIPSSDAFPYHTPVFPGAFVLPQQELSAAINNPLCRISYKGIAEINGHSVHHIQVERATPRTLLTKSKPSPYDVKDYFIDASVFQIVAVQETLPKFTVHQVDYANYAVQNGISVPTSIKEEFEGQQLRSIQLNQVTFNSGITDAVFTLQ
jgi:hypothetical protein